MADIVVQDLIQDAPDNVGVFDALIAAVEVRLAAQYQAGRITGTDFATVYLGSIQSVIAQSIQFVLNAHTANKQADFVAQQTLTEVQNTLKATNEVAYVAAQTAHTTENTLKTTAEITLLGQKNLTEIQNTGLVAAQTTVQTAEQAILVQKQLTEIQNTSLVSSTRAKTDQEVILITNKTATEAQILLKEVANTALVNAEIVKSGSENTLIVNKQATEVQVTAKTTAESNLLLQKRETERGQTSDTLLDGLTAVAGIVGAQHELYNAQRDGFARDGEQKLLKIMMDAWSVARSTDSVGTDLPAPIAVAATFAATITEAKTNAGLV